MSIDPDPEATFQIAHVLTMDLVGYSRLLITEQSQVVGELARVVRESPRFRRAEAAEKLLRIPTGDGMILVFLDDPQGPLECAMEVARALKDNPRIRLRMGIHSGPVHEVVDVNDRSNFAGAGIDMAQRVMDCGEAGHILLSKRVAEDLAPFPRWNAHLHDLGECEVKHGRKLGIVNFYTDEIGNPQPPKWCATPEPAPAAARAGSGAKWIYLAAALVVAALLITLIFVSRRNSLKPEVKAEAAAAAARTITNKSIAVLPFENLSGDPGNAYFADGIQEEILTRLAKIADLKVISRTSTERYKSAPINLSEIARQLGVANMLEGSVQKSADQVRVNVQLIKAEDDSHLWAERYDRKLNDIFAVESEIAERIAGTLQAKLTGTEQRALADRPTDSSEAHELYLRGRFFWNKWLSPDFGKSREFYEKALALDPNYALAYEGLADYYGFAFANGLLPPEEKWAQLEMANAEKALALDPSLGQAYNPLAAIDLYWRRDWPAAERDFRKGLELSPNFAEMHHHFALCLVLFHRNEEAQAEMQRALELDPLSPRFLFNAGRLNFFMRQYDAAIARFREAIEIEPAFTFAHEWLGYAYEAKGMKTEATAEWDKMLRLMGAEKEAEEVAATARTEGFSAAVRAIARRNLGQLQARLEKGEYVPAGACAIAALRAGETEQAIAWLRKAAGERNRIALEIAVNPLFDPLRNDPRFHEIVAKIIPGQTSAR